MAKKVYKLDETPYYFECENITYYFSSMLHFLKFRKLYISNRNEIFEKLSNRYKIYYKNNRLADIYLYVKIESRGFRIIDNKGVEYNWPTQVLLNGENLTKLN